MRVDPRIPILLVAFLLACGDSELPPGPFNFGADNAHVLWVNGQRVLERQGRHISAAHDLEVTVRLRKGWNQFLLKVADLDGGWAFQMPAADPHGAYRWAARQSR